jgi:hypothetical protein
MGFGGDKPYSNHSHGERMPSPKIRSKARMLTLHIVPMVLSKNNCNKTVFGVLQSNIPVEVLISTIGN